MILETFARGLLLGLNSIVQLAIILLPFMMIIEIAKHFTILDYLSKKLEPLAQVLHLPREAAFPLMAGIVFGIIYGAAIIIDYAKEGRLSQRELLLIAIYLSINHSIFEDSIIFAAIGANVILVIIIRFILAFFITLIAGYIMKVKPSNEKQKRLCSNK